MRNKIITIALLAGIGIIGYNLGVDYFSQEGGEPVLVTIPPRSTAADIAGILENNGVLRGRELFLYTTKILGMSKELKSGTYRFYRNTPFIKIIYKMKRGRIYTVKVTIPEGFTAEQIADTLAAKNLVNKKKFLQLVKSSSTEGYMFPETYFFIPGSREEAIIKQMLNEFNRRYLQEFDARSREIRFSKKQVITLASIIEKEAKTDEERKLISGVFHNRLRKGWMLESCATVRYAMNKYEKKLIYRDLKFNSPYNTYMHRGLPPGPICNPGISSIKAALYPAETEDMFFFTSNNSTHQFSKYYKQHLERQKNGQQ